MKNLIQKLSDLWERIVLLFKKEEARSVKPVPPKAHVEKRKKIADRRGYKGEDYRRYVEDGITPIRIAKPVEYKTRDE